MKKLRILSIGTMYLDINCINFPFSKGLFANRETTGNEYMLELGGSALNFAKITNALGIKTTFIGKVGDDILGKELISMLKKNNINPAVIIDSSAQTNIAVHYIHENGTSIMTSSGNANQQLTHDNATSMLNKQLDSIDYLYLGGVFKLKQLLPHLASIAKKAQEKSVKVVLDHGRINNSVLAEDIAYVRALLHYVDIYLPSIDELLEVWDAQSPKDAYQKVKKVSNALLAVKNGEKGAIGFAKESVVTIDAFSVKAVNTVGAGDSFNGGFIKAFSEGQDFASSITFGCATAAVKISKDEFSLDSVYKMIGNSPSTLKINKIQQLSI